jgi:hypothetical protein
MLQRLALATVAFLLLQLPIQARANMGPRETFELSQSRGVLGPQGEAGSVQVRRVSLVLDFRLEGRGESLAHYDLVNTDPNRAWQGEVAFLAEAEKVSVVVDGAAVETRIEHTEVRHHLEHRGSSTRLPLAIFSLALEPGQIRRVTVAFHAEPASHSVRHQRFSDGRHRWGRFSHGDDPSVMARVESTFAYPLWPVFGFDGTVGEMSIVVRADRDAEIAPRLAWQRQADPPDGVKWSITLPAARSAAEFPARELVVSYPEESVPPLVGASVFTAAAFATAPAPTVAFDVRATIDLVATSESALPGGWSLGAEVDTSETVVALLDYQCGTTFWFFYAFLGGGPLLALSPGLAPGLEGKAGLGVVYAPLTVSAQVFPYRPGAAGDLGLLRVLVGMEAAF